MGRKPQPIKDKTLKKWLGEFKKVNTKKTYLCALRAFKRTLNIKDLGEYLKSKPDAMADIHTFLNSLEGKPTTTISSYVSGVRIFFLNNGIKLDDNNWRKLKRRGFIPKRVKAETRDKKPSKAQLKRILNYADIKLKALTLYLLSSGGRIGETVQLKEEDLDLNADPPKAHIRGEYTKGEVGERTVYFSYEARDAIRDWLAIKDSMGKRDGSTYKDERVFPFVDDTARIMWNRAIEKAGLGEKDKRTDRRIYHLHGLRKFFRTKVGLDLDVIHALMGHAKYLDEAYLRLEEQGEIAEAYLEAMPNVSVYEFQNEELKEKADSVAEENKILRERLASLEAEFKVLKGLLVESLNGNK